MTVVDARRYSRNSGATSAESETGTPGSSSARMAPIRCSWAGLTYEWSRQTATDSTSSRRSSAAASRTESSSSSTSTSPAGPRRSRTPTARSRGTSGFAFSKRVSYSVGRTWRAISSRSRKPSVVTKPLRAILPSMIAFVATVVAWTTKLTSAARTSPSARARSTAPMKPSDGSAGVVSTFADRDLARLLVHERARP